LTPLRVCIAALLAIGGLLAPLSTVRAQASERLVLAFYYTWFDRNSWAPNRVPDVPQQPYVSSDRAVMGRQIDQAKAAGIDAFVVSWYGPSVANNQTETNLRALLDEAAARGFRIAVDLEVAGPFFKNAGDVQAALGALLATHAQHPAYLRSGGKPVVFFWRQQRYNTGTWKAIRDAVDPGRGSLWIEEGVDVSPLSVFDGHHLYSVTWNPQTDMAATARKFAQRTRAAAAKLGAPKVYVATVMPGYDDRKTGRSNAFAVSREGGAYYERSWQAAISSAPDWIVITSFNEWPEGTYIEPSKAFGSKFLDMTAQWAAAFRNSSPPPPSVAAATPATPTVVPTPPPGPKASPNPAPVAPVKRPPVKATPSASGSSKPTPAPTREPIFGAPGGPKRL
jgi:hypothetical protein